MSTNFRVIPAAWPGAHSVGAAGDRDQAFSLGRRHTTEPAIAKDMPGPGAYDVPAIHLVETGIKEKGRCSNDDTLALESTTPGGQKPFDDGSPRGSIIH